MLLVHIRKAHPKVNTLYQPRKAFRIVFTIYIMYIILDRLA